MTAITAFPTIHKVLYAGDNIQSFKVSAAVKAGMVLCINATGVDWTVEKCVAAAGSCPVGVALTDQATVGAQVAVGCIGTYCTVQNYDDTATMDAGDLVMGDTNAVGGTVKVGAGAASWELLGRLMTDMAAGGTAVMQVLCGVQNVVHA